MSEISSSDFSEFISEKENNMEINKNDPMYIC